MVVIEMMAEFFSPLRNRPTLNRGMAVGIKERPEIIEGEPERAPLQRHGDQVNYARERT
jgi:hypothetical protein